MKLPVEYSDKEPHIKIAYLRKLKGLSQVEIAELLEMSQNAYGRIERGETKLTVDRIKQIAKVLNVKYYDLLSGASTHIDSEGSEQIELLKEELRLANLKRLQDLKEMSKKKTTEYMEEKKLLKEMIKEKEKVISLLEDKVKMLEEQLKNSSKS
ncbi:helix-turn-helix domain-containing protein [Bernardetia sp.]|uniref:helix-turn-helix domain-containing protein n=1 Tax=Bernardetia sp. TaxID=1937974 RepID=UPI0025C60E82|nr:helix-turn-helix transcriptional regulator [Bernardetia sp.]